MGIFVAQARIMRIVFFSRPKPKQFIYRPRYWDERKEELDRIQKKYAGTDVPEGSDALREQLSRRWRRKIDKDTRKKTSSMMMLVYLVIAALLAWFIFAR